MPVRVWLLRGRSCAVVELLKWHRSLWRIPAVLAAASWSEAAAHSLAGGTACMRDIVKLREKCGTNRPLTKEEQAERDALL